jgi:IS5 family transposase
VTLIIEEYLTFVLAWCSRYLYERLLSRWQDERLVQCQAHIDFTPIARACAPYHQRVAGQPGRPISHSVPKLVRVLYLMYQENCSYRQTESRLRRDLLWRWFAGYGLFDSVPAHNTIFLFDQYVRSHHPRLFFDTILQQIDAQEPAVRQRGQIGDTFAVLANAALEGPTRRLRHLCSRLLSALDACQPEAYEQVVGQLENAFDEGRLFGWEEQVVWSDEDKRQARRQETVLEALACRELVRPYEADHEPVQTAAALIDKMIADEFALTRDEQERIIAAVLLPHKARGSFRICSATDPEATIRNHGPGKKDFGFNAAVAATDEGLIREIQAHTGSCGDATTIPDLLTVQQEFHDLLPKTFSFDQIAGTGKTAAAVHHVTNGQTQLLAEPMPNPNKKGLFTARNCHFSEDGLSLTCPHGRISRRKYRSGSGDGDIFRFLAAQCLGCPLLAECRGAQDTPTTPRNFFVSSYMAFFLLLLALSRTEAFRQQMKKRPRIELVIAHLVLFHGARRARCRGTAKVDYQLKMAGMAYNVKWWLNRLKQHGKLGAHSRPQPLSPAPLLLPRENCVC